MKCPVCGEPLKIRIDKMTNTWRNVQVLCKCGYELTGEMDEEYVTEKFPKCNVPDDMII